jgi:single-strand DNA-binding protein
MGTPQFASAGEILSPWIKMMQQRRERMDKEGTEAATLPGMGGENGGIPIPEENEVRIVGKLVNLPKVKAVSGGHKMAVFTLAVSRTFRDGDGRKGQETAFVPVVAWRALAEQVEPLGKGSVMLIEGRLRTWTAQGKEQGKDYRWNVEAVLLEVLDRRAPAKDDGRVPAVATA